MNRMIFGLIVCGLLAGLFTFPKALAQDRNPQSKPKATTQEVIAEGVGATADEAIKDAYRNAVRQVVGAVVDAETLIKDDEVIEDNVLTYSDGFIKGYEEVPESKKVKGGLHRIKIKAQVERRSVIAKLKAANVTMKEVDGKSLFAEAVTQIDAETDGAALLKKQFDGFPQSCITAMVIGKPELVEKSADQAKVKLTVQIEPDLKAYKAFVDKLIPILDKLAKDKGEFTAKYGKFNGGVNQDFLSAQSNIGDKGFRGHDETVQWMPKLVDGSWNAYNWKKGQVSIAVATNRTKTADSIDYKYYVLDPSLETVLRAVALQAGQCKLQLLDAEGEVIATDRFEPLGNSRSYGSFYGSLVSAEGEIPHGSKRHLTRNQDDQKAKLYLLFISSVFGSPNLSRHQTTLTIPRSLTLSLDELKSVKDAKVEITFDE